MAVRNAVDETIGAFGCLDEQVKDGGIAIVASVGEFSLEDFD